MPEAPIDEYRNTRLREDDVSASPDSAERARVDTKTEAETTQRRPQCQLAGRVPAPCSLHAAAHVRGRCRRSGCSLPSRMCEAYADCCVRRTRC
jgi:hypothetical protein